MLPAASAPPLPMLDCSHDFMRRFDVKTLVGLDDFSRFRTHAVDRDMDVIIIHVLRLWNARSTAPSVPVFGRPEGDKPFGRIVVVTQLPSCPEKPDTGSAHF